VSITTPIEALTEEDGTVRIRLGTKRLMDILQSDVERGLALRVEEVARQCYAQGRKDQHRETAALLKGVLGL
jgi:hypothetical protein